MTVERTIQAMLTEARIRIQRLSPTEAQAALRAGAVLIDIRPQHNRETEGGIPGAVPVDRTVLEWRLDPSSAARLPIASYDVQVVVFCNEGFASSLAAATLVDLGISRAGDLIGGYRAWRAAGLPTSAGLGALVG